MRTFIVGGAARLCKLQHSGNATVLLSLALMLTFGNQALAQGRTYVSPPVRPYSFSGDLSKLPKASPSNIAAPPKAIIPGTFSTTPRPPGPPDPVWQKSGAGQGGGGLAPGVTPPQFTTPSPNFDTSQPGDGPPDDNGAVGPNHYIAIVNFTFQIFDKQGNSLAGPTNPQSFWSGAPSGDPCKSQRGDPYVNYDHLADRWVISFFANQDPAPPAPDPNLRIECIAVSKGPNPVTGGFFAYTFALGFYNDYPKIGVWPDGYYMITQRGYDNPVPNLDATVFDRANMLNGNPATFQRPATEFTEHDVVALPSELTGPPPPAGSPNFYARQYDGTLYGDGGPRLEIFEFHTDWGDPTKTTFGNLQTLTPATFRSDICNGAALFQYCVPQPGSTTMLDAVGTIWPMGPLQYRNFGDHESLIFNSSVNLNDGSNVAGIRWYELRRTPPGSGSWVIQQQGTFAPADSTTTTTTSIYRWTGSIAMDKAGNIALGYNVSNDGVAPHPTVYPGIRIVGRLATDPLGEMTTPEVHVVDGGGSGIDGVKNQYRWGDYSAMRVDPADGCTFWYTTEYIAAGPAQQTRVAAVRFPTCNPANLSITKTASPNPVTAGTQLNYTITVTNNGPATATNVVVSDTLPAGTVFLSSSVSCTGTLPLRTCNLGPLASGAFTFFTIQVKVASSASSAITNTATVAADQLDPDLSDNTSSVTTNVVQSADLSLIKTCKPDTSPAPAGTTAFCTLQVNNLGPSDASAVSVTDNILSNTTFTITSAPGCTGIPGGAVSSAVLSCVLGPVVAGGSATITVSFTAANGGDINDTAVVSSSTPDPNNSNNSATGKITFASVADLSITKTATPNPVVAGTNLTYTITVHNAGPSTATGVVMADTIPGQVSVLTVTPSVGTCTAGVPGDPTQPLTCTLGNLASGGNATITVVTQVSLTTPGGTVINNSATVSSAVQDPNNANNSAIAVATVQGGADLSITKVAAPNPVVAGTNLTYTISVHNGGPTTAPAVVMKDTIPGQVSVLTVTPSAGTCTAGIPGNPAQPLTCTLGTLASGGNATVTVVTSVSSSVPDGTVINNNATVSSAVADPNNANNSATAAATVQARADLSIVKSSDASKYKPSTTIAYTVTVTNNGPSDALAVIVTDNLPTIKQANYLSDTGGCTISGLILTCKLGNMPTGTTKSFNIYELVNGAQGAVSNTASVTSSTVDPNSANNTSTRVVTVGK